MHLSWNCCKNFCEMLLFAATFLSAYIHAHSDTMGVVQFGSIHDLLKLSTFPWTSKFDIYTQPEEYPSIENLHDYLEPFSNCFVHIKNHKGVDIHPTTVPIILSEMEALLWRHNYSKYNYDNLASEKIIPVQKLTQKGKYVHNKINSFIDFNCTSGFFIKTPQDHWKVSYTGYCLAINHTHFVMNSRPWSCQVQLDIFAPLHITNFHYSTKYTSESLQILSFITDLWYYPQNTSSPRESTLKWIPSKMSMIKANIIMIDDEIEWIMRNAHIWLKVNYNYIRRGKNPAISIPQMDPEIYITILTKRLKSTNNCRIIRVHALNPWSSSLSRTAISKSIWASIFDHSNGFPIRYFFPTRGEMEGFFC